MFLFTWAFVELLVFLLFFPVPQVFATRSLSFTSDKSSLFGDEMITLNASCSGFTDGESIYIKGAFYEDGSTNYFGYTKKGDEWIKNGESTANQRAVIIGQWDGQLVVKSNFSDSGYKGEKEYKLKVGYYYTTSGGNLSGVNWSGNAVSVALNEPDPTPTNTPTHTPTSTPTAAPTSTSTSSPSPTPKPTLTSSPKNTVTPTQVASGSAEVAGASAVSGEPSATASGSLGELRPLIFGLLFIGLGLAVLSLALIFRRTMLAKDKFDILKL